MSEYDRTGQIKTTTGTRQRGQYGQDRTVTRKNSQERKARKEKPGKNSQERTARKEQPGKNSQEMTARIGQPE